MPSHADTPFPTAMNLGCGEDFREGFLNIDTDEAWGPDASLDLSTVKSVEAGIVVDTERFGRITLREGAFDHIVARDVLQYVPDLMAMMTTCLDLLKVDGLLEIAVPYDLSLTAWQDPLCIHAFNERSWAYYVDWFIYPGWTKARFHLDSLQYAPSALGDELKARNVARDEIVRTPRAIDAMMVGLRKVELTETDLARWKFLPKRKQMIQAKRQSALAD